MEKYKAHSNIKGREYDVVEISNVESFGCYWNNDHDKQFEVFVGMMWFKDGFDGSFERVFFCKLDSGLIKIIPEPDKESHVDYKSEDVVFKGFSASDFEY